MKPTPDFNPAVAAKKLLREGRSGALATLMVYFKPLWMGILRAALMLIKPRKSLEQRIARSKFKGQQLLRRMANDHASSQPNLAAELRLLAGRD